MATISAILAGTALIFALMSFIVAVSNYFRVEYYRFLLGELRELASTPSPPMNEFSEESAVRALRPTMPEDIVLDHDIIPEWGGRP